MVSINRKLQAYLQERLNRKKVLIILGPRQTGKTTLLKNLQNNFDGISEYLNCDDPEVAEQLLNLSSRRASQLIGKNQMLLIDEGQRVKNIGLSLKILHDSFPDIKIVVTGSSSFELANEINEPLTGRKFEHYMYPISVGEYIDHYELLDFKANLENRIRFGMYPEVITNRGEEKELLRNLASSYLYKDLLSLSSLRKPALLEKLLQALAFQIGSEASYTELGRMLQVDNKTVESYIQLLEQAFIVFRLNPLSRNLRNEINKSRKIYFYDTGIRNAVISNFQPLELRNDTGALWENFFIAERMKANAYALHNPNYYFWRTHLQQEIDFIEETDGVQNAYEIKWNNKRKTLFSKSYLNAYPNHETHEINPANFLEFVIKD
ncbi:MAG: ATP-binding protein [Cyclobacteriaceae bacterium]